MEAVPTLRYHHLRLSLRVCSFLCEWHITPARDAEKGRALVSAGLWEQKVTMEEKMEKEMRGRPRGI